MKQFITYLLAIAISGLFAVQAFTQPVKSKLTGSEAATEKTPFGDLSKKELSDMILYSSYQDYEFDNRLQQTFTDKPGLAFLSSAILPGSAQAVNHSWIRSGLYMAVEAASIYFIIDYHNRGVRGEQRYEQFADNNWSVVQYANWLVDYHDYHGIDNPYLEDLRSHVDGADPAFNTDVDWNRIDIDLLRDVERYTPYLTPDNLSSSNFSHILPQYGSQQYYELIAKYFQYQAGWMDYNMDQFFIDRNGSLASPLFFEGIRKAEQFNDDFRTSKNLIILLISNHIFSAFDAYFTFTLKQNRIQASSSAMPGRQLQLRYNF